MKSDSRCQLFGLLILAHSVGLQDAWSQSVEFRVTPTADPLVTNRQIHWMASPGSFHTLEMSGDLLTWAPITAPTYGLGQDFDTLVEVIVASGGPPPPPPPPLPPLTFQIRWVTSSLASVSWVGSDGLFYTKNSAADFSNHPVLLCLTTATHQLQFSTLRFLLKPDGSNALPAPTPSPLPAVEEDKYAAFVAAYDSSLALLAAHATHYSSVVPPSTPIPNARAFFRLVSLPGDIDGDLIPDPWEFQHSLNPFDPADASQDADGDGISNLAESTLGANPNDPDVDGDGVRDGLELLRGTDLKNPPPNQPQPLTKLILFSPVR